MEQDADNTKKWRIYICSFFYKALPWLIVAVMVIIVSIQMKGKDKKDDDHPKREEY